MEKTLATLTAVGQLLDHAKVMKDRDRDMDKAFKALHAAVSRLFEVMVMQAHEIEKLQKAKAAK